MQKFQRNYICTFEIGKRTGMFELHEPEDIIEVKYPTTLILDIARDIYSSANTGIFQFYNLPEEVQAKLWIDPFQKNKYVRMTLKAGYGQVMPTVFTGLASQCSSYRSSGSTDFITEIQADDALYLFQYGFVNSTLYKNTSFKNVLNEMLSGQDDCEVGWVTDNIENLKKNTTFCGQTMDVLTREYGKYQIFVENGKLNVLDTDDVIPNDIYVITANSGLLGSPRRGEATVELETIFEPGLITGQAVQVLSDSMPWLNAKYKILALSHKGIISPTTEGKLTTRVTLSLGKNLLKDLNKGKEEKEPIITEGKGWLRPVSHKITGEFSEQRSSHTHKGVDYGCPMNTPIKATFSGIVSTAGWVSGFGYAVYLNHGKYNGNNVVSIYGHLSKINVVSNQRVSKGDIIAYSGNTGISTGPHLHFQINENGKAVNPNKYIGGK